MRAFITLSVLIASALACVTAAAPPTAHAAYPGRNGKIAYAESDGAISNGSSSFLRSIWSSGRGVRTHATGDIDPAYSPSGRTLALADEFGFGIWIKRPEGRRVRRITRGSDTDPDFAPSGRSVVFVRSTESGSDGEIRIYHGRKNGLLTHGSSPAWSSRREIAFTRTFGNPIERTAVYTIGHNGRNLRFVTFGREPDWSPSGRTLVIVTEAGRLATIRPSGVGLRHLTRRTGYSTPAFSPDGRSLAAVRSGRGEQELVTLKLRTNRLRNVLWSDTGFVERIDWQPRPRRHRQGR